MDWQAKVAVVTGAGGTLCSEIAADLAAKGMKVVLIGRTASKLEKTAAKIAAEGGVSGCAQSTPGGMFPPPGQIMRSLPSIRLNSHVLA